MESNLWSYFKCQRCGQCCEKLGLPWYGDNIEKMAEFLKVSPEDLVIRYYGDIVIENGERCVKFDETRRTPCPFLQKDKTCQVYPFRPHGCKFYPIETDFGRCGVDCPAMKIIDEMDSLPEGEEKEESVE